MPDKIYALQRWGRRAAFALGALLALASCGGSTEQVEAFVPLRLIVFGDELSALTTTAPTGRNYGINGINANGTNDNTSDDFFDCLLQPNWVQSLASVYRFVFAECNAAGVAQPQAINRAAPLAKVADVEAQVQAQDAAGGIRDKDLATVLVGVNDVIELYGRYTPGADTQPLVAEAGARGRRAAAIVNSLIDRGARVIVSNIPDVGLTPFAIAERNTHTGDIDRAALLSALAAAFIQEMGKSIVQDGRYVGLAQMFERTQLLVRSPSSFGFDNVVDAACATAPPDCTRTTLVTNADSSNWLWASDRWLSYGGQAQLASLAIARAQRNPF